MSTEPRVSVIIPCFNRAHLLRECLLSLSEVASPDWEVIVVDDGSTENIRSVVETTMPTARYIRQDNQGAGAARNTGIKAARGRYIRFLDSDDYLLPGEGLQAQLDLMEADPEIGLVYGQSIKIGVDGRKIGVRVPPHIQGNYVRDGKEELYTLLFYSYITTSTTLIRHSAIAEVGDFRADLPTGQDWELWVRIAKRYKIGYVDLPISAYRIHTDSITSKKSATKMLDVHLSVLCELFADEEFSHRYGHLLPDIRINLQLRAAHMTWSHGDSRLSRQHSVEALCLALASHRWKCLPAIVRSLSVSFVPIGFRQQLHTSVLSPENIRKVFAGLVAKP